MYGGVGIERVSWEGEGDTRVIIYSHILSSYEVETSPQS